MLRTRLGRSKMLKARILELNGTVREAALRSTREILVALALQAEVPLHPQVHQLEAATPAVVQVTVKVAGAVEVSGVDEDVAIAVVAEVWALVGVASNQRPMESPNLPIASQPRSRLRKDQLAMKEQKFEFLRL